MTTVNILLISLGGALMFIWHLFSKPKAPVDNTKVNAQVTDLQTKIDSNNTTLVNIQKEAVNEKATPSTANDDASFLDKR